MIQMLSFLKMYKLIAVYGREAEFSIFAGGV